MRFGKRIESDQRVLPSFLFELSYLAYHDHYRMPPHRHPGSELIVCFSGFAVLETDEARVPILPGTITALRSDLAHHIDIVRPPYRRWLLHFDPGAFGGLSGLAKASYIQFRTLPNEDVPLATAFRNLLGNLALVGSSMEVSMHRAVTAMLNDLSVHRAPTPRPTEPRHDLVLEQVVRPVIDLVHASHYRISQRLLAKQLAYSEPHLRRMFRQATAMSISDYIRIQRLAEAKRMLLKRSLDLPISVIATQLGFRDTAHFSRHFKQHVGCSPTEYQRLGSAASRIGDQALPS